VENKICLKIIVKALTGLPGQALAWESTCINDPCNVFEEITDTPSLAPKYCINLTGS
jgi:hypothetical protein